MCAIAGNLKAERCWVGNVTVCEKIVTAFTLIARLHQLK